MLTEHEIESAIEALRRSTADDLDRAEAIGVVVIPNIVGAAVPADDFRNAVRAASGIWDHWHRIPEDPTPRDACDALVQFRRGIDRDMRWDAGTGRSRKRGKWTLSQKMADEDDSIDWYRIGTLEFEEDKNGFYLDTSELPTTDLQRAVEAAHSHYLGCYLTGGITEFLRAVIKNAGGVNLRYMGGAYFVPNYGDAFERLRAGLLAVQSVLGIDAVSVQNVYPKPAECRGIAAAVVHDAIPGGFDPGAVDDEGTPLSAEEQLISGLADEIDALLDKEDLGVADVKFATRKIVDLQNRLTVFDTVLGEKLAAVRETAATYSEMLLKLYDNGFKKIDPLAEFDPVARPSAAPPLNPEDEDDDDGEDDGDFGF